MSVAALPLDEVESMISTVRIDGQKEYGETVFPYIYACDAKLSGVDAVVPWVARHRERLLEQATAHGAILFRGFPLASVEAYDTFISALELPNFPYEKSLSNAVRINATERVFSANEAPSEVDIFFHHEMAQTPLYPRWIMFYCSQPAVKGGASPLCRSDILFEMLKEKCPQFIADCERKGLQYTNVMPGLDDAASGIGRSWQSTLGVNTREAAEARLRELNYSWEWLDDDCLKAVTPALPAVMEVSAGRKTFFNQLIAAFSGWKDSRNDPAEAVRHGDGAALDVESVQQSIQLAEEIAFDCEWQTGDAVIVDNTVAMHARRPFEGTRKVFASLASMQRQSFEVS